MRKRFLGVSSILALLAAACGDDGDGGAIDASSIDASIDASNIDAAIDAPELLPGEACSNAEPITLTGGTATITASTAAPYMNNHQPGSCAMVNSAGPDRVHSITIPTGQRLTATVDPTSATYDPGIFVIAAPAANCDAMPVVCLASNDAGGDGQNDAITFDNTTGAPLDVLIIIDGFRPDGDAYTLTVTVGPPPV